MANRHDERGAIAIGRVDRTLCKTVRRAISHHYAAAASVNQGIPMVALARGNPISRALVQWGTELGIAPLRRTGLRR